MAIRSLSDINAAFDAGSFVQRFQKNAGTAHAKIWADCTFASGQPAYDAHGQPCHFHAMRSAEERCNLLPRHRHRRGTVSGRSADVEQPSHVQRPDFGSSFDLLGYYPLIDGDSTDTQAFDNTPDPAALHLRRGVFPVMVSHAPQPCRNGLATIEYTDSDGNAQTCTIDVPNNGKTCRWAAETRQAQPPAPEHGAERWHQGRALH